MPDLLLAAPKMEAREGWILPRICQTLKQAWRGAARLLSSPRKQSCPPNSSGVQARPRASLVDQINRWQLLKATSLEALLLGLSSLSSTWSGFNIYRNLTQRDKG